MQPQAPRPLTLCSLLIPLAAAAGILSPWASAPIAAGPFGRSLRAERRAARLSLAAPVPRVVVPAEAMIPGPVVVAGPIFPMLPGGFLPWPGPPPFAILVGPPATSAAAPPAATPAPAAASPAAAPPAAAAPAPTAAAAARPAIPPAATEPARKLDPDPAAAPADTVAPDGTRSVLVTGGESKPAPAADRSGAAVTQPPVELLPTRPAR